jgi:DNA-binding MarR family transcriptional regulator
VGNQFTTGHKLKAAWHSISRMYNSYTTPVGISVPMAYVLLLLSGTKGTLSTQIAPLLGMEAGSLTRLLKSMEENKLIERKSDQEDKRQVSVYLTEEGKTKRRQSRKIVKVFNDLVQNDIDPEQMKTFFIVLQQIVELAENNHFDDS